MSSVAAPVSTAPRRLLPLWLRLVVLSIAAVAGYYLLLLLVVEGGEKVQIKWKTWGEGTRMVVLDSPFRLFIEPLLEYIEEIVDHRQPNETITIVVPQFMPSKRWHNALHMRTADVLRQELLSKHGVVVTDVPYHVHKEEKE